MPHSFDKMRAINTLIAHSLSPLVCLIYFCLYIIITKEVHPYAEESVLYLYNSSSSIVDTTINAKDFAIMHYLYIYYFEWDPCLGVILFIALG